MAFVTVYNTTDSPVMYDSPAHFIGGQEYGTVDPAWPDAQDDIDAGRLDVVFDPGGDLAGLPSDMRQAILATRFANAQGDRALPVPDPVPLRAYAGQWMPDVQYPAGYVVTYRGGNFVARSDTPGGSTFIVTDWEPMNGLPTNAPGDALAVGNAIDAFRVDFTGSIQPNPDDWDIVNDDSGHLISAGGNAAGADYLRISLSPFSDASQVRLTSLKKFSMPLRCAFGLSVSQRIVGQEVFIGLVGADADGVVESVALPFDIAITGATGSVTSNVLTLTATNHGLQGGDRVTIFGCTDTRLNAGPVVVTVVDSSTITVPLTLANGTYSTVGGTIREADPVRGALNAGGLVFENATATNASFVTRRNGSKYRLLNSTVATTTATQTNTSPYSDAFNAASWHELVASIEEMSFRSVPADATGGQSGIGKFSQSIPDEAKEYKLRVRARTLRGFTKPVARITAAAKTGTTTVTITTDVAHGLTTNDWVNVYGVRDQTNFPNLTAITQVASVPSATSFTVVMGSAATASSSGGVVWQTQGGLTAPGVQTQAVQSASITSGILTLVGSATWSGPLPGEMFQVHGVTASGAETVDGAYKILRVNGTSLELDATGKPDLVSVNSGGAVFRRTDVRLHFVRALDYTRLVAEIQGGRGNTADANNSVPVSVTTAPSVVQSTGSGSTIWQAAGPAGLLVADVASAAITSSTTTGAVTPGQIANVGALANAFNVSVTAVSGTTPTLDVGVEESPDNGTTWYRIYDFPRITATGVYWSPLIPAQQGTRYRYVQTVTGTTPSFTRSVNRTMTAAPARLLRSWVDRAINPNTLNSSTPVWYAEGCDMLQVVAVSAAGATVNPQVQLEGSDDPGPAGQTNWYPIGAPITLTPGATVQQMAAALAMPKWVRVRVSTAGTAAALTYLTVRAMGR